ncbi:winged helix-turn-helix domain-containing protein [Thalassotalea eurytherma]|uniref:Transcriptional regulator n=1 Tax=Thalassotalea eurytherma TaxID=1144278 RepID=A0ABQ6H0Y8_9GAMM|nr:winged helix-turn-helix domain-containing protein [Thalassotalea eurytherma]GLX81866.1 transcriptional regulator [Thalassotalea eurytherma]
MNQCPSFYIGEFEILPLESAIIDGDQKKQTTQPKFIEVLCYLAQNYPRVVPREELIEHIWDNNDYVGEKALTNAVWHLRQLFKKYQDDEVIETIRKVGYRLLIEPKYQTGHNSESNPNFSLPSAPSRSFLQKYSLALTLCLVVFIVGYIWQHHDVSHTKDNHVQLSTVTKKPGTELFPSPSPDGRFVAYQWSSNTGDINLFLKDVSQPELTAKQLTFDDDIEGYSVWSNDGQSLFFARKSKSKQYCHIIELAIFENRERKIADCPRSGGYYYIDISPDGETLAFHGRSSNATQSGIYFISLTKENAEPIRFSCDSDCNYKERDFAFSPDGKSIAVTRRTNRFSENIFLIDIESKIAKQLTYGEEDIVGLSWQADGQTLIYATQRADVRQGYKLNLERLTTTPLAIEGFSYPAIARSAGDIFFHQRKENYGIVQFRYDQKIARMPTPIIQSEFSHLYAHYSKANDQLVYVSNESGFYELWLSDTNGKHREKLTQLNRTIRYPRWSHKGHKIAFLAPTKDEQSETLFILDLATKRIEKISSAFSKFNRPTWTLDDNSIISAATHNNATNLYMFDLANESHKQLTTDNGRFGMMISDNIMLYTKLKKGLWQKNILQDDDSAIEVIPGTLFNTLYTWDHFNNAVFFNQKHQTTYQLTQFNFATKTATPLLESPKQNNSSSGVLSIVPANNSVILTLSQYPQADIKKLSQK